MERYSSPRPRASVSAHRQHAVKPTVTPPGGTLGAMSGGSPYRPPVGAMNGGPAQAACDPCLSAFSNTSKSAPLVTKAAAPRRFASRATSSLKASPLNTTILKAGKS